MGRRLVLRENACAQAINDLTATITRLTGELNYFKGALEDCRYMRRTFVDGEDDAELDEPLKMPEVKHSKMVEPNFGAFIMGKEGMLVPKVEEEFRPFKPTDGA
jgi:hypothetical protein